MSYDHYRTGGANPGWDAEAEAEADYLDRMRELYSARYYGCAHCEGVYEPDKSDAIHVSTFCSIDCERAVFDLVNVTPDARGEASMRLEVVNRTPASAPAPIDQPEEECPF